CASPSQVVCGGIFCFLGFGLNSW
nr:immunoglobulin heavy chain junction region [Macaca mulatta]MOW45839.1 immunoglobulin heavy chain junction region [Macaca mulatta]MOW47250.1 immunoglobulin heavy chain junction region [Macaca mulatta]MOW48126.1 immunoglobulin heavy chain junction region [Macaca mulatta]MOW48318.1 immunoglobulin heavy chain junction region [Macaca mulatta]